MDHKYPPPRPHTQKVIEHSSVADPGCLSRIPETKNLSFLTQKIISKLSEIWSWLFIPGFKSWFFTHPQKIISKLSEIWSWLFIPGSKSWFFTHPGSRIQGSERHRIPDQDPQHWNMAVLEISSCWCGYKSYFSLWYGSRSSSKW